MRALKEINTESGDTELVDEYCKDSDKIEPESGFFDDLNVYICEICSHSMFRSFDRENKILNRLSFEFEDNNDDKDVKEFLHHIWNYNKKKIIKLFRDLFNLKVKKIG